MRLSTASCSSRFLKIYATMKLRAYILGFAVAGMAAAQATSPNTDANTGIAYQQFSTSAIGGYKYSFGIALPTVAKGEFIGRLVSIVTPMYL